MTPRKITWFQALSGYRMEELATEVGVSPAYLRMIRAGTRVPSRTLAESLMLALDLDPSQVEVPLSKSVRHSRDDQIIDLLKQILVVCKSIDSKLK